MTEENILVGDATTDSESQRKYAHLGYRFNGRDPRLIPECNCTGCKARKSKCKTGNVDLLRCSIERQKDDFERHKRMRKLICKYQKALEEEEDKLHREGVLPLGPDDAEDVERVDPFESCVGAFWLIEETRPYMKALWSLAQCIYQCALVLGAANVWEESLDLCLEILRLDPEDCLNIRHKVPFIFLHLNRDDEAYSFIRYWTRRSQMIYKVSEPDVLTLGNKWTFSPDEEDGCRYEDMYEDCGDSCYEYGLPLPFSVALLVIKLRLVATFGVRKTAFETFMATQGGSFLYPVHSVVADILGIGDEDVAIFEDQSDQLDLLLNEIQDSNPLMLPSLVNPKPMTGKHMLKNPRRGFLSEAKWVIDQSISLYVLIPGANEILVDHMDGLKPGYDSDLLCLQQT